jgi:hypothetical protein
MAKQKQPSGAKGSPNPTARKPLRWNAFYLGYSVPFIAYLQHTPEAHKRVAAVRQVILETERCLSDLTSQLDESVSHRMRSALQELLKAEESLSEQHGAAQDEQATGQIVHSQAIDAQLDVMTASLDLEQDVRQLMPESNPLRKWLLLGQAVGRMLLEAVELPERLPRVQLLLDRILQLDPQERHQVPILERFAQLAAGAGPDATLETFEAVLEVQQLAPGVPQDSQRPFLARRIHEFANAILDALTNLTALLPDLTVGSDLDSPQAVLNGHPYALNNRETAIYLKVVVEAGGQWVSQVGITAAYPEFGTTRVDRLKLPPQIEAVIERQKGKGSRLRQLGMA